MGVFKEELTGRMNDQDIADPFGMFARLIYEAQQSANESDFLGQGDDRTLPLVEQPESAVQS